MTVDAAGSPSTARDRAIEGAVTSAVLREVAGFRRSIEVDALTALMETLPIVVENAVRLVPAGGSAPADKAPTWDAYQAATRALSVWHGRRREALRLLDDWQTAEELGTVEEWANEIGELLEAPIPPAAGGSAPHQGATTARAALRRVVDVLDFADGGCELPVTAEIDTDVVRAALVDHDGTTTELRAAVRALLGAGETTDETGHHA